MKIVYATPEEPPRIKLRDLPFTKLAERDGAPVMRVRPCNLVAPDAECTKERDTLIVNLKTGSVWYAEGDGLVRPIEAALHIAG